MNTSNLPKIETLVTAAASLATVALIFRSIANDLIPDTLQDHIYSTFRKTLARFSSQLTIIIEEFDGLTANQMFQAANLYLGSNLSRSTRRIKVNKPEKEKNLTVSIDRDQELIEIYKGVKLKWVLVSQTTGKPVNSDNKRNLRSEVRYFELSFNLKYRDMVLSSYLPYILNKANAIREEKKTLKLHTVDYHGTDYWGSINFDHPAEF